MAMKIIPPRKNGIINGETPKMVNPLAIKRRMMDPRKLPGKKEPLPPNKLVPPKTAEATAMNS
jgi:hypothetical protein